jgi:heme ABC exporter ATP-binding subunit CcmA
MTEAILLQNVWKYYGEYPALRDYSLKIEEHSCWALIGRNGAGKTTLLRILGGLTPFQRGTVRILGESPRSPRARRQIGFLGHGIGVYDDLSARENLVFFARLADIPQHWTVVDNWLERVGLAHAGNMPVRQFSRGMRQRLALARTFLHRPNVLLLDEPFTSLDDRAICMLTELLAEARQRGATIVLSTHQIREALSAASHVGVMENGKLRYAGERTPEMIDDPTLLYKLYAA